MPLLHHVALRSGPAANARLHEARFVRRSDLRRRLRNARGRRRRRAADPCGRDGARTRSGRKPSHRPRAAHPAADQLHRIEYPNPSRPHRNRPVLPKTLPTDRRHRPTDTGLSDDAQQRPRTARVRGIAFAMPATRKNERETIYIINYVRINRRQKRLAFPEPSEKTLRKPPAPKRRETGTGHASPAAAARFGHWSDRSGHPRHPAVFRTSSDREHKRRKSCEL